MMLKTTVKNFYRQYVQEYFWILVITVLIIGISILHYKTPTMRWQYHLVYMQAYFIPIILAAFQYGIKGGLGTAMIISIIYLPHIILQWGGLVETNLMRFLQIGLFNVLGYLTGLKAQGEKQERIRYQKAAEELQKSMDALREQSEKLLDMERQLRSADRLAIVGQLTASLAHEVRNPLGSIRGAVEILRDQVPEDVRNSEFFDILIQETQRLNEVVEHYLNFVKKHSRQYSIFDAREVIQQVLQMLASILRKQHVQVITQLPDTPLMIQAVQIELWQVLMNVLLNSVQAASQDGGEIHLEAKIITQNAPEEASNFIQIRIADNGPGISEEKMEQIFTPFYTTKETGTGLGLSIVKQITESNKWQMELKSIPGKGTVFILNIPAREEKLKYGEQP